jgi:hypothetical protein
VGLILGLAGGLLFGLFAGLLAGLFGGLIVGLFTGLFLELSGRNRRSLTNDIQTVEALSWSWEKALKIVPFGLIGGVTLGLVNVSLVKLNPDLVDGLQSGPIPRLLGEWIFVPAEYRVGLGVDYWGNSRVVRGIK